MSGATALSADRPIGAYATSPPAGPPARRRPAGGVRVRLASGAVLAVLAFVAIRVGNPVFDALIAIASGLVAWEWARMCAPDRVAGASATLAAPLAGAIGSGAFGQPLGALVVLVVAAPLVWLGWRRTAPWLAAGVVYLGLPCVALLWLRQTESAGAPVVLWLFVVVCASDVGAYAAGRLIGGPKLVPRISPNKTWAGATGGFAVAIAAGAAFVAGQGLAAWPQAALASAGLGVCAQAGDLLESWIKRRFGVKDTSSLIPGHGGLLDRVDSLMMASLGTTLFVILSGGFAPA